MKSAQVFAGVVDLGLAGYLWLTTAAAAVLCAVTDVLSASLSALDAREALDECVHAEHVLHTNFFTHMFKQVCGGGGAWGGPLTVAPRCVLWWAWCMLLW